jgi:hypothetical protein
MRKAARETGGLSLHSVPLSWEDYAARFPNAASKGPFLDIAPEQQHLSGVKLARSVE